MTVPKDTKYKQLTVTEQTQAIELWKTGDYTYTQLAEKFGRSESTFKRLFAKEGVSHGQDRDKQRELVATAVANKSLEDAIENAKRIFENTETVHRMGRGLFMLASKEFAALKDNLEGHTAPTRIKMLAQLTTILKDTSEIQRKNLRADEKKDFDTLPSLEITGITDEEAANLHRDNMLLIAASDMGDEDPEDDEE